LLGHYVKNGNDDISITISLFYHSNEIENWCKAMKVNNRMRRFGMSPNAIAKSPAIDYIKAILLLPVLDGLRSAVKKLRGN
jgi:hypothetical protein